MLEFKNYLLENNKSNNTIENYIRNIESFKKWYYETTAGEFKKLYRPNVLDYKGYLRNIKKNRKGQPLKAESINANLSALAKYNEFLVYKGIQKEIVINDKDFLKVQHQRINPCTIDKSDVENFRQKILENESKRDYAIITVLAYTGLRISECLNIKMNDFDFNSKEIIIRDGKGDKQRIVYFNEKIENAIKEYLKERKSNSEYLFCSRQSDKVCRSRINQLFSKYSNVMHPHLLRHFAFTNMASNGFSISEIAMLGGHSSTKTTEIYINPSQKEIKEKLNLL